MIAPLRRWLDAVRRNHALEHATVAVLLARHGPSRLGGRASGNGFLLMSEFAPEEVAACAQEALLRLQRGEAHLAVSPLCGTNIAVAGLLAAGAASGVLAGARGGGRLSGAFAAAMLGVLAAQPLGRLLQRHVTTRADLDGVSIAATRRLAGPLLKVYTRPATP